MGKKNICRKKTVFGCRLSEPKTEKGHTLVPCKGAEIHRCVCDFTSYRDFEY